MGADLAGDRIVESRGEVLLSDTDAALGIC